MNQPTPAIVAQDAVRRLPRLALLLFCLAYVLPGFIGREPWKNADIAAFGHMVEIAQGHASWLAPTLLGQPPEFDALLPYWLGAAAIQLAPSFISPDLAVRLVFPLLLVLTLVSTWYGVYYLARTLRAQPVPFAFGGEANPTDYARAMADGGLLALIACLGLGQFSHETTPSLAQVAFASLSFFAMTAIPRRPVVGGAALIAGFAGMALSGAPAMALLFGLGGLVITVIDRDEEEVVTVWKQLPIFAAAMFLVALLALAFDLWHWRISDTGLARWQPFGRLLLWFTWPAWPLALWTLWRWRRQLTNRHVALPLWFTLVGLGATLLTPSSDRSLLLALPAMAALAAFALPTLSRSVSALIDWFTLLFFTGCAVVIWVVWIAMQTGYPPRPAANVARLAPGFEPSFSLIAFVLAIAATLAWAWLVKWRTGRHRTAIWKSLVLPAGGAALCWLLVMTLWLPALNYARGYTPLVRAVQSHIDQPGCVEIFGLSRAQITAFHYHGGMDLRWANGDAKCPWLLVNDEMRPALPITVDIRQWTQVAKIRRPSDANEDVFLFRRSARP
ncbi:hypothetical protein [Caenimonas koreensis]|uniref:4-amino-4-deoxy-L-arabinose transferase n=1 Tax=Caenimonas koreensis DSM 17982 TaxID=1121255 RepID=A0A844B094_9BURK|nr:hypothetical protein [Caenimonas koreensis]MRD48118.1 hypothetical protein [Caenimonas koreensis DSM 17982]